MRFPTAKNVLARAFPDQFMELASLYQNYGEKVGREFYLSEQIRIKLMRTVYEACHKNNITFACCREGFTFLDTGICDGLHLIKLIN